MITPDDAQKLIDEVKDPVECVAALAAIIAILGAEMGPSRCAAAARDCGFDREGQVMVLRVVAMVIGMAATSTTEAPRRIEA